MLEHINEIAVVGCSLCMLALYVLWYTVLKVPTEKGVKESIELASAGAALLIVSTIIEIGIYYFDVLSISPMILGLLSTTLGAALLALSALKQGMLMRSYLIHAAFIGIVSISSVLILTYWPW